MLKFTYTKTANSESILIQSDNAVRTIASTSPRFADLRDYLFANEDYDESMVLRLADAGPEALDTMRNLSERVSFNGTTLFFDGDKLDNSISQHIVRMIQGGDDSYESFILFLENLATNPDKRARRELFSWVQGRNFTITADGRFIAYKGVQNVPENLSVSSGVEPVWVDGVEHKGHIPNPVGATITMSRSLVDDGAHVACSTGLHAGTHNYASGFGSKLLVVAINPRDVVSVPRDSSFEKLRVCRYEVLGEGSEQQLEETTYGRHRYNGDLFVADKPEDAVQCSECGAFTDGAPTCSDCSEDISDPWANDECDDCNDFFQDEEPERDGVLVDIPRPTVPVVKKDVNRYGVEKSHMWLVIDRNYNGTGSGRTVAAFDTRHEARDKARELNSK